MDNTTKEIYEVRMRSIEEDLEEWSRLVTELSEKEVALYQWRECYNIKSEEIIQSTDFKALYGKNNDRVRKEHVKRELVDWFSVIRDLEFSIDFINRRIVFLKELIRTKRAIMEVRE